MKVIPPVPYRYMCGVDSAILFKLGPFITIVFILAIILSANGPLDNVFWRE